VSKIKLLPFILILCIFLLSASIVAAQVNQQIVETRVGQVNENSGGSGLDLPAGVFRPPFKCGKSYVGSTYSGHSPYSVDFNGASSQEDGQPVLASANGTVRLYIPSCGEIHISHKGGYETVYVHMKKVTVRATDKVSLGQKIGEISDASDPVLGCTASGPHLHSSARKFGNPIRVAFDTNDDNNPEPYPASILNPTGDFSSSVRLTGHCP